MTPAELTRIREKRGWTEMRLAAELEVSRGAVSRWEAGLRSIPNSIAKLVGFVTREEET